ncbi:hypothetical protein DFH11DRAFT_1746121 [Phellopilus nigrolimitatus]|nr:hypothetical protein DFH11DRAFT_1746121 [Phellopilus nigrolimitatus]
MPRSPSKLFQLVRARRLCAVRERARRAARSRQRTAQVAAYMRERSTTLTLCTRKARTSTCSYGAAAAGPARDILEYINLFGVSRARRVARRARAGAQVQRLPARDLEDVGRRRSMRIHACSRTAGRASA